MGWMAALPAALSIGSSIAGMFGKKGGTQGGYDVVTLPQYSFTEPRYRLASDYVTQNLSRMSRGENPVWWDRAMPTMREGMMRGLNQSVYGRPGERYGTMQNAMDTGAILGMGAGSTNAQVRKQQTNYLDKSQAIDEYLAGLTAQINQQGEQTYMQGAVSIPQGPSSQVVSRGSGTYGSQSNPWQDLGQSIAGMDWSGMFNQGSGGMGMSAYGASTNPFYTASGYNPITSGGYNSAYMSNPPAGQYTNMGFGNMVNSQYL